MQRTGEGAGGQVTEWLRAWGAGDELALHDLIPAVERELNRIAHRCLAGERPNRSVSATALVNETFLRLVELKQIDWQNRSHFLAMSARLMRRILVDLARARQSDKRGGGLIRVTLDEGVLPAERDADLLRLDVALEALAGLDVRKARVVELRFFGGLTADETAELLGVTAKTVLRDWSFAKAWLQQTMSEPGR
jgi:RNA polymerase sigma-70 factor (ECF subfamily)